MQLTNHRAYVPVPVDVGCPRQSDGVGPLVEGDINKSTVDIIIPRCRVQEVVSLVDGNVVDAEF